MSGPADRLRLVSSAAALGVDEDELALAASMARHPSSQRQSSQPEPRLPRWLRIGRRA